MAEETGASYGIAGAGLAGSLMAACLAQAGETVDVYERRSDPRTHEAESGRSINLALSHRGLSALEHVGIADAVQRITVPMRGRLMHSVEGTTTLQPYGVDPGQVILSVSRAGLNRMLVERAAELGARFHFRERVRSVDPDAPTVTVGNGSGGSRTVRHETVIGADGAFSAVRHRLQRRSGFNYSQTYLTHGYKELSLPPTGSGDFAMDPQALHIWPRGGFMMIALPNLDRTYTVTMFLPFEGDHSFSSIDSDEALEAFFARHFADARPLIPDLPEQYRTNPVGSLVTVRCGPWFVEDKVVLIGDAAHAVVPFYGQGMNASFEDCALLMESLDQTAGMRASAFDHFYGLRKPDADALAGLAVANYQVMRDRVQSKGFLWGRKAGRILHRLFPTRFIPLYTMVTFTSMPYAEAEQRWQEQLAGLKRIGVLVAFVLLLVLLWFFS